MYEVHRHDFADAYLAASAERTGIGVIASFDRSIDRVTTFAASSGERPRIASSRPIAARVRRSQPRG